MAVKREYGAEQPGVKMGMFVLRIPGVHYRIELAELLQGILMCATCLGAIPIIEKTLNIPFEYAWGMVIINGFLYTLHATFGDPVVPGWITPSIPITTAYLMTFKEGPERIQALIAVQLLVAIIFLVMGVTGIAGKLLNLVPNSLKSGILLGAGFAALIGEFKEKVGDAAPGRFNATPITIGIGSIVAFFILFSLIFKEMRKKSKIWDLLGSYGMLPAIIIAVIVGPIAGEFPLPKIQWWPLIKVPDFKGIIQTVSPFAIGFPSVDMFMKAIPMSIIIYIIAFGDFVTSEALLSEADEARQDEKIIFNANRSNFISGVRNLIEAFFCAYPTLAGPLWAAVTASVAQRYKEGRDKMDSIFSGVGTFRWTTFFAVALIPVVSLVKPILPAALSMTLIVQGYVCIRLAMEITKTSKIDKGMAGVIGAVIVAKGATWGLMIGILLHFMLKGNTVEEISAKED